MKKNIMILGVIIVLMSAVCYAGSFVDDTSAEFDLGVYNWTAWKISDVLLSGELPDYDVNSAVDTTGLVGLWHMNGDANDTSGNNNHGTINGATTGTEGKLDTAMSFDGTNDYVDVGTPLGSTSSGTKAVSLWVKSIEATTGYVIANYDSNSHGFSLLFNSDRTIGIAWTSTINAVKTTDTLPLNEWFHVVGIFETGATGGKIYIDGTESVSGNLGTEQTTTNKLRISGRWVTANSGSTVVFNGSIDEVAIWNRALSPDEISAIYNTQKDNHPSSGDYESKVFDAGSIAEWNNISWAEDVPYGEELPDNGAVETVSGGANMTGNVLLMHMDEASGTIEDTSGNNNDGTASGGVTYEASGKFDKALSFDGSTGYVERSYDPDFTPGTNSWTVEAWVKTSSGGNSKSIVDWYRCGADPSCSSSDSASYLLGISSNNKSYWYVRDDYSNKVTLVSPSSVVDNSWHHLVGTYSPSPDSIKLYVDGVEVNSSSSVNFISLSSGGTSIPLEIGRHYIRSWGSPSSYFNGLIDEVAIFNRALSADEILDHYKRGALRLNISAKSCDDADCAGETTWDKTCTSSSCNISTLSNSQYLQYKIDMRSDSSSTPEVSSVSVFYGIAANPFTVGGIELIYRTPVNITEDSGSSLTDYQVLLTVDTASLISAGKMQADCDDIRITDSDGSTELSYWLESGCNTASTRLWVKVPSLAASSTKTLYMYYGNASISTESNGSETFPTLFKDFENDDLSDWDKDSFSAFETSTEQFVSGMKSLKAYWSGTGIPKASLPITVSKDYIIEFDYMEKSGTNEPPRFVLAEIIKSIGGISFASFIYNSPYYIYFLNSSSMGQTFVTGLSSNTWYHLAINPKEDTDTFDLWFDNSVTKTISDGTIYNGDISTFNYFTISLGKGGGPTTSTAYFDNLRIRKYTSTEPTYTIGSEQQNVATPCTDNDGDGYGAEGTNLSQCTNPTVPDCNDTNADINPEAYDIVGNGIDEDCSGADADYNFSIETDFLYPSETSTYYVGDDIWYQVTIKRDGVLYDPPGIELNLTNHYGTLYGSHIKSDMTHVSSGVYKGYFDSTTFDNSVPDIRYDVWIYGDMNEQLDYNVHYDFTFPDGTVPSFISTAYTYLTDALSNHTVKDLVVNSSEAKIDWSGTKLDLHARNIDLDSALTIGDRSAYLDSAAYSELNDSATLTFYNVNCASAFVFYSETANTRAAILAENKQCLPPRCTDIGCSGSTLTVTVSSFTGYAAQGNANLTIDADDPKFAGAEVHFTADYRNVTDDILISGATCTIYFTDGNYPMAEGADIYTYNRTFATEGLKDYNVTCSKTGFSTLTAFDNATIVSVEIPEFSLITLGLGLIAVLAGLIVMRKKR